MKTNRIVAIIQAHMSSSRLPGKVMKDLCGEPALYRMIERLRNCKYLDEIVVATSYMECDDVLVEACEKWGVSTFRGSNNDVLARFWGTVQAYPADAYVRLTSDCPAIDPEGLDDLIQFFWDHDYHYVKPVSETHFPGCWSYEVFTAELMKETYENATEGYEREHVTPYMYTKQDSQCNMPCPFDASKYQVSVDTPEDYAVVKSFFEALYPSNPKFTTIDIAKYLDEHPEVYEINRDIVHKHYTQCSYDNFDVGLTVFDASTKCNMGEKA